MEATAPEAETAAEAPTPSTPVTPSVPNVVTDELLLAVWPTVEKLDRGVKDPPRPIAVAPREATAPVAPMDADDATPSEESVTLPVVWTGAVALVADWMSAGVPAPPAGVVVKAVAPIDELDREATAPLALTEAEAPVPDKATPLSVP